jgi:hypothetical protein
MTAAYNSPPANQRQIQFELKPWRDDMNRSIALHTAGMLTAVLLGAAQTGFAQPPASPAPAGDYSAPAAPTNAGTESPAADQAISAPVLHITTVEVIRSSHAPALDIVRVRGLASTPGWEEAELVPLTRGVPADGVLELMFVAKAPAEASDAKGFEAVEAIFPLETNHPFKGVNVRSASESLAVLQLPGYSENKGFVEDCSQCVGKYFLARGAAAPAGKPASELVREDQLPVGTRIVRHSEGIASADSNPNRLTLIVAKDGRIKSAVWD